jgi:tripartite ATP-independent transporter DctP family solute receptor
MKNRFKLIFIFFLCLALLISISFATSAFAKEKVTMIISGSGATVKGNHTAEVYKIFKMLTELYSDWEMEVKIFPQGTYGGSQQAVLAVRNGECHMFNQATNNFAVHAPSIFPFSLPYMFNSFEQLQEMVDGPFGKAIADRAYKESGLRIVGYHWAGWRAVSNSVKPIKRLEDMKGMKIRVPKSPTIIGTFKAWGVNPTPIGWNETFTALQQGVADGFDNPVSVIGSFGFYEVQKYVTTLKYQPQACTFSANDAFWRSLSPKHKAAVELALKEAIDWEHSYLQWSTDKYATLCRDKGMIFYDLPADEEARWREKARAAWPSMYDICGGKNWVENFDRAAKEADRRLATK